MIKLTRMDSFAIIHLVNDDTIMVCNKGYWKWKKEGGSKRNMGYKWGCHIYRGKVGNMVRKLVSMEERDNRGIEGVKRYHQGRDDEMLFMKMLSLI